MNDESAEPYYRTVLRDELERRCSKNARYSLRAFAKALGLDSGTLSLILAGRRIPSAKIARKILLGLAAPKEVEQRFWNTLTQVQRGRGLERMNPLFRATKMTPIQGQTVDADKFAKISEWYHYAILELTYIRGFRSDPQWIASQLGIPPIQAKLAVERLLELGFLTKRYGRYHKRDPQLTTADKHLTSAAHKRRQKQILEKAIVSLENDPLETRSMTGITMAIDPKKLPEAKEMIRDFNRRLCALLESGTRKQVYELSIALFPLQKG